MFFAKSIVVLFGFVILAQQGVATDEQIKLSESEQKEQWWGDLAKPEPDASKALLKFAFKFEKAIPFLKQKMNPTKIEMNKVRPLLENLASEKEEIWKPAFEELDYFDPRLANDLVTLMNDVTDKRARPRLVSILCGHPLTSLEGKDITLRTAGNGSYNFYDGTRSWWAEADVSRLNATSWGNLKPKWMRATRALLLLGRVD